MSELTSCNYCNLQRYKRQAKEQNARLYLRGQDVFIVPKGQKLDMTVDPKTGNHTSGQWVAWLMEITDHCVC